MAVIFVILKLETSRKLHSNLRKIWRGRFPSFFRYHLQGLHTNTFSVFPDVFFENQIKWFKMVRIEYKWSQMTIWVILSLQNTC